MFAYTPQGGVASALPVVYTGTGSWSVNCTAIHTTSVVIEIESSSIESSSSSLVRLEASSGIIDIGSDRFSVNGHATPEADGPLGSSETQGPDVPGPVSVVVTRDTDGATALATRTGSRVRTARSSYSYTALDNGSVVTFTVAASVTRVVVRWYGATPRPCWFGWWVPVRSPLVVRNHARAFEYTRGSFTSNAAAVARTGLSGFSGLPESGLPESAYTTFVALVDLDGVVGAPTETVLDVRAPTHASFGIERETDAVFVVVGGARATPGIHIYSSTEIAVVCDATSAWVHVRGGESAAVSVPLKCAAGANTEIRFGPNVARATMVYAESKSTSTSTST